MTDQDTNGQAVDQVDQDTNGQAVAQAVDAAQVRRARAEPRGVLSDMLPDFLAWLGVKPDDPDYAAKQAAAAAALFLGFTAFETYLDRDLAYTAASVETFLGPLSRVNLRRYPLEQVSFVTVDGMAIDATAWRANLRAGVVYVGTPPGAALEVTSDGGYSELPGDLQYALWLVAGGLYPSMLAGSSAALIGAPIARVSIPDVGTIEYATPGTAGGAGSAQLFGPMAPSMTMILDRYRAESAVGAG